MSDIFADIAALYDAVADLPPIEPIHLTRPQMDWLRTQIPAPKPQPWEPPRTALFDTPIYLVGTVEESTPYLKGWTGWPPELMRRTPWWRRLAGWLGGRS